MLARLMNKRQTILTSLPLCFLFACGSGESATGDSSTTGESADTETSDTTVEESESGTGDATDAGASISLHRGPPRDPGES